MSRSEPAGPPDVPTPPWRTPRKAVPSRAPITQDLIVTTALRVLDAESLEAVSMRRVAQELDTGPASLYAHVANKKELLDLMFDRVAGEIDLPGLPAEGARWREQIRDLAVSMHATMSRHSDIARVALANIPTGPNALVISERMLAIMLAGGIPVRDAAWMLDRVALYICADAYESSLWAGALQESGMSLAEFINDAKGGLAAYFRSLPSEHFPNIISHVDALTSGEAGDRFLFGLDLMLDGLAARAGLPPT